MKKKNARVTLSRETIYLLAPAEEKAALGAATTGTTLCSYSCPTYFCTSQKTVCPPCGPA